MRYPGGKNGSGTYQRLINLMPPHTKYVEGYLGSGAILRLKKPAETSIGIDKDIEAIKAIRGENIPGLELYHVDFLDWLQQNCQTVSSDTLIYLDPPYLMETRSCQRPLYRFEFGSLENHQRLLMAIRQLPCMVMISGYYSDLYGEMLQGWRTVQFQAITRGGKMAAEWVWMNYPVPVALHDYRYLGGNFRERERIKRRQGRWKNRLEKMTDLERYAMLAAIQDLHLPTS